MSLSALVSCVLSCVDAASHGNTTVEIPCSSVRRATSWPKSVGVPTEMWLMTLIISSPRKPCRIPARLSLLRVSPYGFWSRQEKRGGGSPGFVSENGGQRRMDRRTTGQNWCCLRQRVHGVGMRLMLRETRETLATLYSTRTNRLQQTAHPSRC